MLEVLTYFYLALPLGIFLSTWLRKPYAVILVGALILSYLLVFRKLPRANKQPRINVRHIVFFFIVLVWTYYSGAGGFSFQNGDWIKHNAILSDLVLKEWPIRYSTFAEGGLFLNYYLGWYMVPAVFGKIFQSMQVAFVAQFVWTLFGVFLSLAWLHKIIKKPHWSLYLCFILFGTADSLGIFLLGNTNLLNFITPLEHWSTHEYSSFTTLLYWVPGQAIGIWITMGALTDAWKQDRLQSLPIWIALLTFWSPFGVIGTLPFVGYFIYFLYKKGKLFSRTFFIHTLSGGLILLFFYLFFHANIFTSTHGKEFSGLWKADNLTTWGRFGIFLLSEALLPISLIFLLRSYLDKHLRTLFYLSIPILVLLPFYRYGLLNDLVMRASIPALYILFICGYTLISSKKIRSQHRLLWLTLITYFVLGAITPLTEINRSLHSQPNVGTIHNLQNIGDDLAIKQYLGSNNSIVDKYMLR